MSDFSYDYSVLVIAEADFLKKGVDCDGYISKLMAYLEKRSGDSELRVMSVTGNYGLAMDKRIEVDDRNKTAFVKSLDDHLLQFNEVVFITNYEKDSYIDALSNRLSELSKTLTVYSYKAI
ncbi:hypothetical protein D5W64_12375 [Salmonella enterica subsp. enterica serovar Saintpaul]|nr:hypothetical protein [Salmonella enterica subsp. enterica serovar Saintpaul]